MTWCRALSPERGTNGGGTVQIMNATGRQRRDSTRRHRAVGVLGGRVMVNTPKSGKPRTIDTPISPVAQLRERHSVRQAEAVVAGAALGPWIFPSATDPNKPTAGALTPA